MFKFTLGAISSALVCYVMTQHPDLVREGFEAAREQISVAARNISTATEHSETTSRRPPGDSVRSNPSRVRALTAQLASLSNEQLWGVMDDSDFDRRAAAARVLLDRAEIPASTQGVQVIKDRYFRSGRSDDLKLGFSYIGLLANQRIPEEAIVTQAQRFVERYPRHEACDYAVWALGEMGSEEMVPYFFQIIQDSNKYGPAARERAFCCLSQCGRYSPAQRVRMVPDFIDVYKHAGDAQTRKWSLQALALCAPSVQARSIDDWSRWWSRQ
jgi:hypothetical protein